MLNTMLRFVTVFMLSMSMNSTGLFAAELTDRAIKQDFPLTRLSQNVHVIHGPNEEVSQQNQAFRNNPVIVNTGKGIVVVDPGSSVYTGEMIVNKVRTLTSDPIVAVFNTHGHGDHWLGNDGIRRHFPNTVIYGHEQMIHAIAAGEGKMWIKAINERSKGAIEGTRAIAPEKAIKDGDRIRIGNITFQVYDAGKAHSDSDIMIYLVEENIFLFGDTLRIENLGPFMSSFSSNLKALDLGQKLNAAVYVPGHGKSGGKKIIGKYRGFITSLKVAVKKYYDQGLSDYEMKAKVIDALGSYKNWSSFDESIGRLISLMYLEVESEGF